MQRGGQGERREGGVAQFTVTQVELEADWLAGERCTLLSSAARDSATCGSRKHHLPTGSHRKVVFLTIMRGGTRNNASGVHIYKTTKSKRDQRGMIRNLSQTFSKHMQL